MHNKRERLAWAMDRLGVFRALLKVRSLVQAPVLSALCYHSVGNPKPDYPFDPEVIDATPEMFRAQLELLANHFSVISIDQLCRIIEGERPPPNPVLITFDDGYKSCVDTAMPILQEFGLPATFFLATSYITERRLYWWDTINYIVKSSPKASFSIKYPKALTFELANWRGAIRRLIRLVKDEYGMDLDRFIRELAECAGVDWNAEIERKLADELIMSWDDIRTLRRAGMDIESHTRSHRVLATLSLERLHDELVGSRTDIERELGEPVRTIAYPVGYSIRNIPKIRAAIERAGYKVGFTAASGVNYLWGQVEPFDVRRLSIDREVTLPMFIGQLALPPLAFHRSHT